ncbi:MAG: GNAT family N-acetyltransferase [Oscillospiraceae bacterium]|nr:GNAT family N-acetyltransferase [Oscillospiraceae bacterium]MCR5167225.1 GNAT family N-acetyltransferase [Oscillospiraceae bacterium]
MSEYKILKAEPEMLPVIGEIVSETIREIYPRYYTEEVVDFFLELHNAENIGKDISAKKTYIIYSGGIPVGTGTVDENHLCRLFVLPEYQGKGAGTALLDYLEDKIIREYGLVLLDSSLPSGEFYRKRHYHQVEHREHHVKNGKILSYEVMCKRYLPVDPDK